jgi:hypothetical protein
VLYLDAVEQDLLRPRCYSSAGAGRFKDGAALRKAEGTVENTKMVWLVVGISLVAIPPSALGGPEQFVLAWGAYGAGPGLFDRPVAVAVNSAGEVYVGDSRQGYVQRFSSDGHFLGQCSVSTAGRCPIADAIAVDPTTDRVIVADPLQYGVQIFTRELLPVTWWNGSPWGGVGVAYGIAVGPSGDLFIAGGAGHNVSRWTQDGALIERWPDPGSGPGRLQSAWGIGVDAAGSVYLTEYAGSRVVKFTADGEYLTSWGSLGSGPGQFASPTNVSIDPTSRVFVADPYNNRIEEFTSDGAFLSEWGTLGQGPGQFSEPYGVATFHSDVFVGDAGNSRIQKFGFLPTPARRARWGELKARYR